jgi:hypothetical protein
LNALLRRGVKGLRAGAVMNYQAASAVALASSAALRAVEAYHKQTHSTFKSFEDFLKSEGFVD